MPNEIEFNQEQYDLIVKCSAKKDMSEWNDLPRYGLFAGINIPRANLNGSYLVEADLGSANLKAADLSGADLNGANLSWANLDEANLSWANLSGASLYGANISGANLKGTNLTGVDLGQVNLFKSNIREADLNEAQFNDSDLRNTNLSGANLRGVEFKSCDLSESNFSGADLNNANIVDSNLRKANFSKANLKNATINNSILNEADFSGVDITRAKLIEVEFVKGIGTAAKCKETNFSLANLSKSNFKEADFRGANLYEANLIEGNFRKANFSNADLTWTDLIKADFQEAILCNTNLTAAMLIRVNLSGADISGAIFYGTSRDEWIIHNVKCDYMYWDLDGKERKPKDRNFEPGEFEDLYKSLPEFTYYFSDEFTPLSSLIMEKVVNEVNQKQPHFDLRLDSFHSRGIPHAVFTILQKENAIEALKEITTGYEKTILKLESKLEILKDIVSGALDRPQLIQQANQIINDPIRIEHMGNTFNTTSGRDTNIATDRGTVNVNQDVINRISKTISESDTGPDDKEDAKEQLDKMTQELAKPEPDKGRIKRCYDYVVGVIPRVAEVVPWGKLIEKTLGL